MDGPFRPAQRPSNLPVSMAAIGAAYWIGLAAASGLLLWNGDTGLLLELPGVAIAGIALVVSVHVLFSAEGWRRVAPIALCAAAAAVVAYVPFQRFALERNFEAHRSEREAVVNKVLAGALQPDGEGLVAFDGGGAILSSAGHEPANRAAVSACGTKRCVLFFTFQRTKFQPSEGFLYVPAGGTPSAFNWYGHYGARAVSGNWYYAQED
jgi:hypothetical protein